MDHKFEKRVVLFFDLHAYSSIARELGSDVMSFIQAVFQNLGDEIVDREGKIIKYLGDSVLATFREGFEPAAIEAAIAMRKKFQELVKEFKIQTSTELEVGIGVGELVSGTFGHSSLRVEDIFGEIVNETAIICHHRGVAITEAVHEVVKNQYSWERLPDSKPKWRETGLRVWELSGQAGLE